MKLDPAFDWFTALTERLNPDGSRRYGTEELEDFFAAILLTMGFDLATLPGALARMMSEFVARAGIEAGMTRRESISRVERYFRRKPLNRELVYEMKKNLRDMVLQGIGGDVEEAARTFSLFAGTAIDPSDLGLAKPAPEGSVKGGPLGFFAARKKLSE